MLLNADLNERVVVETASIDWTLSPAHGVLRRRVESDDRGVWRDTSLLNYAPGTALAESLHEGGEEILVLEGDLHDEARSPMSMARIRPARGCAALI
jgi:anti-sigma factor ChrR (cupin superfamily)